MPKITLPPQVKCWRCEGQGSMLEKNYDGWGNNQRVKCDCAAGYRYVFDDLAEKVVEAGYDVPQLFGGDDRWPYYVLIRTIYGEMIKQAGGPNPTTALLSAIEKFNEQSIP